MIVAFDRMPRDVIDRLRRVGVTHAALFKAARAAAVVGPASSYRKIRRWTSVVSVYRETVYEPQVFQTKFQLGVDRVRAGERPLRTAYTGDGVTVAVIDSGIDTTHPDLDDRVVKNLSFEASALLDPITDGEYSRSHSEVPAGVDPDAHGTIVAGVLAGTGEAVLSPDDMSGVAPDAALIDAQVNAAVEAGKVVDEHATIYETNIIAAYQWLLDHKDDPEFPSGIRVVNNSFGGQIPPESEPVAFTRMLEKAISEGMILVTVTGNAGPDRPMTYPGRLPFMITVGGNCKIPYEGWTLARNDSCADGADGAIWRDSGRGTAVDVVAPATPVWGPGSRSSAFTPALAVLPPGSGPLGPPPAPRAASPQDDLFNRLNYFWAEGTSMSAPQVSGIVALMLEANPDLTHAQAERILQETATDLGPEGFDTDYGFGQVDAFAAVWGAKRFRPRKGR